MPKIIENVEQKLVAETRRQIQEAGYSAMTVRSVAAACGVGVGTVYNYFPSKDALVAAYMLEDWKCCMESIRTAAQQAEKPEPVVRCMYDQLRSFAAQHGAVLEDPAAGQTFAAVFRRYHGLLRKQLSKPLEPFCSDAFAARFVAEALLTWTMAGIEFPVLYGMIDKLFQ